MNDITTEWVLNTIKTNPEKYGGDNGANEIMVLYLQQAHPKCTIDKAAVANLTTIDRERRKILAKRPDLDRRTSLTQNNGGHTGKQTVIYDFIGHVEHDGSITLDSSCLKVLKEAADKFEG